MSDFPIYFLTQLSPLYGLYSPWNCPGWNTGVGSLFLLHEDLPNPGMEPRSPTLQVVSLPAEPQGKPPIYTPSSYNFPRMSMWVHSYVQLWKLVHASAMRASSYKWKCSCVVYCAVTCRIGEGHANPLPYPCLESPMDRGARWAAVHGGHKESGTTERLTHRHTHTRAMCRVSLFQA